MHRILVVDDSRATRSFATAALETQGDFEVVEAANGLEAFKFLPQQQFDVIITDINMPEINGLEVIRFARNHDRYKTVPLIVISTEGAQADRDKALALGADEYLVKPFDAAALVEAVRRYIPSEGS